MARRPTTDQPADRPETDASRSASDAPATAVCIAHRLDTDPARAPVAPAAPVPDTFREPAPAEPGPSPAATESLPADLGKLRRNPDAEPGPASPRSPTRRAKASPSAAGSPTGGPAATESLPGKPSSKPTRARAKPAKPPGKRAQARAKRADDATKAAADALRAGIRAAAALAAPSKPARAPRDDGATAGGSIGETPGGGSPSRRDREEASPPPHVPLNYVPTDVPDLLRCCHDPAWRLCSGQLYWIMTKGSEDEEGAVRVNRIDPERLAAIYATADAPARLRPTRG